ncbi:hypothetical protein ACWDVX_33905 [Streptomyces tendae]
MTDRPTVEDLDAVLDDGPWCCTGNAEDCALCTDPNPNYPWICPGHPRTAANERIVGEAAQDVALDPSRRYLRPVAPLPLPGVEDVTHWSVYQWLPMFEAWATGMSLCGASMRQGPLPEGTTVTCAACEAYRPEYERMLAPGYRPEDDDPVALRKRAEAAEELLKQYVDLAAVTHKYPITGGHDCLGENHSCAGCALAKQAQEHLERDR